MLADSAEPFERVLVVARDVDTPGHGVSGLTEEAGKRIVHDRHVTCVGTRCPADEPHEAAKSHVARIESPDPIAWVERNSSATDLLVFAVPPVCVTHYDVSRG